MLRSRQALYLDLKPQLSPDLCDQLRSLILLRTGSLRPRDQGEFSYLIAGSTWYADAFAIDLDENCVAQINGDSPGCRWATSYHQTTCMSEAEAYVRGVIEDITGQTPIFKRPSQAGDYSFNTIGLSSYDMLSSTMPDALKAEKGYYAISGCGGNIAWHTENDQLEIADRDILLTDMKIYLLSALRHDPAFTCPPLPTIAVATELEPARELVSMLVRASGLSAMHMAAMLGHRFSIISPRDGVGRPREHARRFGMEGFLVSARGIGLSVMELARDRKDCLARIADAARLTVSLSIASVEGFEQAAHQPAARRLRADIELFFQGVSAFAVDAEAVQRRCDSVGEIAVAAAAGRDRP